MTLQALIWDVDGTLAETEEAHRHAFNRTFREHGYDWNWSIDKYRELLRVTGGLERITHFLRTDRPAALPEATFVETVKGLHKAKTANYVKALEGGEILLRTGVARILREARAAGMTLAIATTTSAPNVAALINHCREGVGMDWFKAIGAGNIVPKKKPAPDIYTWTLDKLGLDPNQCLALEDSRNGLESALGAGIPTVVTYSSYTDYQTFGEAIAVADCFGEPGAPVRAVAGDFRGKPYIDLDLLRHWHAWATA
ncbi:MAG: HAD family hydrolase [Alphaproteobacteria bacterium]|nr:HAD family hydrolase [Alphaproteobacteria bacterium]